MPDSLKVLFMSAEMVPFAKTGTVAEAANALPRALRDLGHDVRVVIPRYGRIDSAKFGLRQVVDNLSVPMDDRTETAGIMAAEIDGGLPVYFVDNGRYFNRENLFGYPDDGERFVFYSRAATQMLKSLEWQPDIVHLNDWHSAIVANWLKTIYRDDPFFQKMASVFTIHNLAVQGFFGWRILEVAGVDEYTFMYPRIEELPNVVALMAHGILFADVITTVSPTYAKEILTVEYGEKLNTLLSERADRLYGVLNGIDYSTIDPATDPYLAQRFDVSSLDARIANKTALQRETGLAVDESVPLIGCISRLTNQKGFDILSEVIDGLMDLPLQLVLMGTGDQYYHEMFSRIARRYPSKVAVYLTYSASLERRIYAGSDMFLMPSRFEPCGSNQMIAMRYGSVPIVRSTGGLADTVKDFDPETGEGNGFSFEKYSGMMLFAAVVRALETYRYRASWRKLMEAGMRSDFSWARSAASYQEVYRKALELQRQKTPTVRAG